MVLIQVCLPSSQGGSSCREDRNSYKEGGSSCRLRDILKRQGRKSYREGRSSYRLRDILKRQGRKSYKEGRSSCKDGVTHQILQNSAMSTTGCAYAPQIFHLRDVYDGLRLRTWSFPKGQFFNTDLLTLSKTSVGDTSQHQQPTTTTR
ncbi:hypothetical protein NIES25_60330 (plasmid) [Nostoc linckia NIES-25]|nr:hypothetical protein NIES25_60330 [Nostoc linckia NIES-25]